MRHSISRLIALLALTSVVRAADDDSSALHRIHSAARAYVDKAQQLHDQAQDLSPGLATNVGAFAGAMNSLTSRAAEAMESSWGSTIEVLQRILGISKEMLTSFLTAIGNLVFSGVMLYGFIKLPPDFMLVVGLITFLVGPSLILGIFSILGGVAFLASWMPMFFVGVLWFLALFRSAALQVVGVRLGLDRNSDGSVDVKDAVFALQHASWYVTLKEKLQQSPAKGFVRLDDVEAALIRDEPSIDGLQAQITKLESKLDAICGALKVQV